MDDLLDTPVITFEAPAKLNLYLHVIGRRSDGYHLLDTLIAFTPFGDTLSVCHSEKLLLQLDGPFASALNAQTEDNLVLRAAQELADAAGLSAAAKIILTKRIPVAAGLGGGSADAAAVLKALIRLWKIDVERVDLAKIAISLGADVTACLAAKASYISGVGEQIDLGPPLPAAGILLVNPNETVATVDVFSAFSRSFSSAGRFVTQPRDVAGLADLLAQRRNDLTAEVMRLCPATGDVLAALETTPGCRLARMSGSGATCFGLFDDHAATERAAETLADRGWWLMATTLAAS